MLQYPNMGELLIRYVHEEGVGHRMSTVMDKERVGHTIGEAKGWGVR